jgi:hypothetical protein
MDLQCDNLTLEDLNVPGGGAIDAGASGVKGVFVGIRNRAKARKAQKISDDGGYATLTPFQKSLIPVPAYALNNKTTTAQDAIDAPPVVQMNRYIPYVLGVAVVGILVYFIVKRK